MTAFNEKQHIEIREVPEAAQQALIASGVQPIIARIFAARGIQTQSELDASLSNLIPFQSLKNCKEAACLLADATINNEKIVIVADYDADGATAAAIGILFFREMGVLIDYFVPNRFEHGYGLTPEIVDIVAKNKVNVIITVDNGIASVSGVSRANELGIKVLVTDHHLAGPELPDADCIVNPNQPNDSFKSKAIAGVGVMFYVLIALRSELRERHYFNSDQTEPNLANLLDLVALGTVADVVPLDRNNRILVAQGLRRIRSGAMNHGIRALLKIAKKNPTTARSSDFGFAIGPRLNAAGRLTDMKLGIECLISERLETAIDLATELDRLNIERRQIEGDMKDQALTILDNIAGGPEMGVTLFDKTWHSGVVGILASRVKDKLQRPVIAFAQAANGTLKGSGRSIKGVHLRDALDALTKMDPDVIEKFGGHAMAAGLTIQAHQLKRFSELFNDIIEGEFEKNTIDNSIYVDGALEDSDPIPTLAQEVRKHVWGQSFPEPTFINQLYVRTHKLLGESHTKLKLSFTPKGETFDAIRFNFNESVPDVILCVYRLDINDYFDHQPIQLIVETW